MKTFGKYVPIEKAPNKFLLRIYGGPLDIEEFRKQNISNKLWVTKTPHSCTTHTVYDMYNTSNCSNSQKSSTKGTDQEEKKRKNEDRYENPEKIRRSTGSVHTKKKIFTTID
jgi:hypothetical protein